jgi:hypothetical protein
MVAASTCLFRGVAVISSLGWLYFATHCYNTLSSVLQGQSDQHQEAIRLKQFCDASVSDFLILANCGAARALVRSPESFVHALEKTLEVVLDDLAKSVMLRTKEMIVSVGIGTVIVTASALTVGLFIESRVNSWWVQRQLLTQYKKFHRVSNHRQQYAVNMPAIREVEDIGYTNLHVD